MTNRFAAEITRSGFVSHLVRINQLERVEFYRFVFFPGMLFDSFEKWWGSPGSRHTSHEGLDLCLFINSRGEKYRLDETIRVPVMHAGRIVHVMNDFIGQTVVVRHDEGGQGGNNFFSLYAHIAPERQLRIGDAVEGGTVIGAIADTSRIVTPLLPHLHVSLAREKSLPEVTEWTWEMLNRVNRSAFMDPVIMLSGRHSVLYEKPDVELINSFVKFSSIVNA